eukprot:4179731-Amphidinium_carterae.1
MVSNLFQSARQSSRPTYLRSDMFCQFVVNFVCLKSVRAKAMTLSLPLADCSSAWLLLPAQKQ